MPAAASPPRPILIVGGGLAGVAMAWQFWFRGVPFLVVDPDLPETTSRIAAGLVTPITGQRLKVSWRLDEFLPGAKAFYQRVEELLGQKFFHQSPMIRLLLNARERHFWEQRRREPETLQWAGLGLEGQPLVDPAVFHQELGGFGQKEAAWLDTAAYLDACRAFFLRHEAWRTGTVSEGDLHLGSTEVHWRDEVFSAVVLCRGADERHGARFFPWLQWDCARGALCDVRAGSIQETRLVQRGGWLQPRGPGFFRAGSTYEFDFTRSLEESREEVRVKLQALLKVPVEITATQAAIRPIVKRQQLIVGRHPVHERVLLLNGLGSKGVLRAPFFSRMLTAHLLDAQPIEAGVDVRANG